VVSETYLVTVVTPPNGLDTVYTVVVNSPVVELTFTADGADTCLNRNWGGDGTTMTLAEAREQALDAQPDVQGWV
jgi:hypothetical protein